MIARLHASAAWLSSGRNSLSAGRVTSRCTNGTLMSGTSMLPRFYSLARRGADGTLPCELGRDRELVGAVRVDVCDDHAVLLSVQTR